MVHDFSATTKFPQFRRLLGCSLIVSLLVVLGGAEQGQCSPWDLGSFQKVVYGGAVSGADSLNSRFTVHLVMHNSYHRTVSRCSGVVVHRQFILSAGHCAPSAPGEYVSISFPHSPGQQARSVEDYRFLYHGLQGGSDFFAMNPRYRSLSFVDDMKQRQSEAHITMEDLAVFRVQDIPEPYAPIEISSGSDFHLYDRVFSAGVGLYSLDPQEADETTLRWGAHRLVQKVSAPDGRVTGFKVRGDVEGQGICVGDSGGPLFRIRNGKAELLGTISHMVGPEGMRCNREGFVTFTAFYAPRISQMIADMLSAEAI